MAVSVGGPRLGTAPFSCSRTSSDDDPADKLGDGAAQLVSDESASSGCPAGVAGVATLLSLRPVFPHHRRLSVARQGTAVGALVD
jgi:hypothetical protein